MDRSAAAARLARMIYMDGEDSLTRSEACSLEQDPGFSAEVAALVDQLHRRALLCRPRPWGDREPTLPELIAWENWQTKGLAAARFINAGAAAVAPEMAEIRDSFDATLPAMWHAMEQFRGRSAALAVWESGGLVREAQLWTSSASGEDRAVLEVREWSAWDYSNAGRPGAHSVCFRGILDDDFLRDRRAKCRDALTKLECHDDAITEFCHELE